MPHGKHAHKKGSHHAKSAAAKHTPNTASAKPKVITKTVIKKVPVRVPVYVNSHTSVLTSNPTIVNHKLVTPKHMYVAADGMPQHEGKHHNKHEGVKAMLVVVKETEKHEAPKKPEGGTMKVITDYPVYIDKKRESPKDYYLNAGGANGVPASSGGGFFQKAGAALNSVENAVQKGTGAVQGLEQTANSLNTAVTAGASPTSPVANYTPAPTDTKHKKGMSTGAKTVIGVSVAALAVVVGIFLYVRHKNKSKK